MHLTYALSYNLLNTFIDLMLVLCMSGLIFKHQYRHNQLYLRLLVVRDIFIIFPMNFLSMFFYIRPAFLCTLINGEKTDPSIIFLMKKRQALSFEKYFFHDEV